MIERALELVASRLNQHLKVRLQSDEDPVVVTSVVATDGSPAQAVDDKLALFIVNIEKETVSKVPPPRMMPGDRFAIHREPLRLNMLVMLAAGYTDGNYLQALKHISMAMRFLQANAVFDHRNAPEMDPGLDRVVLEVQNLPTQELSHLWGVFGGRYLPSVLYTMRTVSIVPDAIDGTAEPIAEPDITLAVGGGGWRMMRFAPLVSVTVEHDYFADGTAHGLELRPDAGTAKRLAARRYAWRADRSHLTIATDSANPPPDDEADTPFRFLARVTDPLLTEASEPFLSNSPKILRLSMADRVQEPDGRWRLHAGDYAAAKGLEDPAPDTTPHPAVPKRRALFELALTAPPEADRPMNCVIRLASRQVFWTYLVQGTAARGALSIVDADGAHNFDALGEAQISGNHTAQVFRSTAPLALAERPPYRFQLREQGSVAERVLIRRLPSAGSRFRPIPGRTGPAMQAEIFVNI